VKQYRQFCSVARALDTIGGRWALPVRDAVHDDQTAGRRLLKASERLRWTSPTAEPARQPTQARQ